MSLTLSESVLCLKEPGEETIPRDHRLDVSTVTRQTLGVFSHITRMVTIFLGFCGFLVNGVCGGMVETLYHKTEGCRFNSQ